MGLCLRDGPFEFDVGIVKMHPSEGTHRVANINQNYFDSYGCSPPQKLSRVIMKRNGPCSISECKIQDLANKRHLFCSAFCLYIIYFTKVLRIDFASAVLNLLYQTIY